MLEEHQIIASEFLLPENSYRVFNLDKAGFPLAGTLRRLKIISSKYVKNVYRLFPDTKTQMTVLSCVSGDGNYQKPLVIFPGAQPSYNLDRVNPSDYVLGRSINGWISSDCFFSWLANDFYPSIKEYVTFPIIVSISEFCRNNGVILYCFQVHASHLMQPFGVSVYGPLKTYWNEA